MQTVVVAVRGNMRFPYKGSGIGLVYNNSILLGKRSKRPFNGLWSVPGGGFEKDKDKDYLSGAKRELYEETAIILDKLDTSYIGKWTLKLPFFCWTTFFYKIENFDVELKPNEFEQLEWVSLNNTIKKHLRPFTKSEVNYLKKILN